MVPDRDAAAGDDRIRGHRLTQRRAEGVGRVPDDPAHPRLRSRRADRRRERIAVRVADLPARDGRVDVDDLVARRKDRDARALEHADHRFPHRREEPDLRRAHDRPACQDRLSFSQVLAGLADREALGGRGRDRHDVASVVGVLDAHDGVRAVGHRRAGHDPHRLSSSDRAVRKATRCDLPDDPQLRRRARHVVSTHRVAVHRRVAERRHVAIGTDVLREDEAERVEQRNADRGKGRNPGEDAGERVVRAHEPLRGPRRGRADGHEAKSRFGGDAPAGGASSP